MPFPQDLLGKYLNYVVDPGTPTGTMGEILDDRNVAAQVPIYTYGPLPGTGAPTGGPVANVFQNSHQHFQFTFLTYVPGSVTIVPLGGGNVVTGPMSGCYLFTYVHNALTWVAHVGTYLEADSNESYAAKATWRALVGLSAVSEAKGANPKDYFGPNEIRDAMLPKGRLPSIVALFVPGAGAYSMLLSPVPDAMHPPVFLMKVAGVKTMTLQTWSTIKALRTFRD